MPFDGSLTADDAAIAAFGVDDRKARSIQPVLEQVIAQANHHHFVAPTACGSWWSGSPDESGIPHATMSDGCPNGYCFVDFDGEDYAIRFKAARRPAEHQMSIVAPEAVAADRAAAAEVLVNVFIGSPRQRVEFRLGDASPWLPMK